MLFISPPFGNYVSLPHTTSIAGSFTNEPRGGLFFQILKTLRYSFEHGGWINKIGLRNKGIDWALAHVPKDHILSVAILEKDDIPKLLGKIPDDRNIELNVSCPNAEKEMVSDGLKGFLSPRREWCIVKLSPKSTQKDIDEFYQAGFRQFHCSNTLPIRGRGGLSGPALIPYTQEKVRYISSTYPDCEIIAGGGIQTMHDYKNYICQGAHHGSISTLCFHPLKFVAFYYDWSRCEWK